MHDSSDVQVKTAFKVCDQQGKCNQGRANPRKLTCTLLSIRMTISGGKGDRHQIWKYWRPGSDLVFCFYQTLFDDLERRPPSADASFPNASRPQTPDCSTANQRSLGGTDSPAAPSVPVGFAAKDIVCVPTGTGPVGDECANPSLPVRTREAVLCPNGAEHVSPERAKRNSWTHVSPFQDNFFKELSGTFDIRHVPPDSLAAEIRLYSSDHSPSQGGPPCTTLRSVALPSG